ncbi:MAG: MFS transporter [Clostridia bacterium]|nr:MAG: MFS transporter [Clostridia bacterium]
MSKRTVLLILGLAGFVAMADNWVVSPILPAISTNLNVDPVRAGVVITAYMIPFGVFQLVFGPLADRYGKRQMISLTMLLFTVATALCATAFSITSLALYRALTGAFAASVMPISLALIGDIFPLAERQSAIGTFMGISFLGQGVSMAIGGSIAYFLNWRGVFAAYALLAVVSTVLLFTAGKRIPSARNPQSEILAPYARLLGRTSSLYTYLVVLFEGILIVGSFSYLGAYISGTYHYNFLTIGLIMTGFGIAAVIAGRISGNLAAAWGRKPVFLAGLLSAGLADLVIYAAGNHLAGLLVGVILLGLGFMLAHSTFLTIATEFARAARGTAMSLVAFCFMGGGGVGTALGGNFIRAAGFAAFFRGYGLALVVLAALAWLVVRPAAAEGKVPAI